MSKSEGRNIVIKFTKDITTEDVSFNAPAFKVTGKEYQYVYGPNNNGPLLDKEYVIDKVERYPAPKVWEDDLGAGITLDNTENPTSYTEDLVPTMTSATKPSGIVSYNYQYSDVNAAYRIFDNNLSTRWATDTETAAWISYEFEIGQQINKYTIKAHSTNARTAPKNWKLEALEGEQYIALDERNNITWNNGEKKEFICNNTNKYKKYRLNITADNGGGWLSITEMELIGGVYGHVTPKIYTTQTIEIAGDYRLNWLEDKPIDTNIIIEYTTGETQGQWQAVNNGDIITSDINLWIRATLSTEDTAITPTLQDLWIEEPDVPQDRIRIVIDDYSRFASVIGNITVLYDTSIGNLAGAGGAVESFTESFTPTDLIPVFNPNAPDHLTITSSVALEVKEVEFESYKLDEPADQICILPASMTLTITHVGTLPL